MFKDYHKKFVAYIKHLLEVEKHSMEKISKKTGIPMDNLKKFHEEDDIANKFEYEKLIEAFDPNKKDEKTIENKENKENKEEETK